MNHPSASPGPNATDPRHAAAAERPLFIGVDLGKVTTSIAVGELRDDGELRLLEARAERHLGDPFRPFLDLYRRARRLPFGGHRRYGHLRRAPRRTRPGRGPRGDRPGTGGRLVVPGRSAERGAGRRGRLLGAHARRARGACATRPTSAAPPAPARPSRASVPGSGARSRTPSPWPRPAPTASPSPAAAPSSPRASSPTSPTRVSRTGRIFRGLFDGVARNIHSLYDKSKIDGPVVLVGHGALIGPIAAGVARLSEAPVDVAGQAGVFEALGALRFAARRASEAGAGAGAPQSGPPASPPTAKGSCARRAAASVVWSRRARVRARSCASWRRTSPRPTPVLRPSSVSTWVRRARRPSSSTLAPATCWRASTGAPRAIPWRRRRR